MAIRVGEVAPTWLNYHHLYYFYKIAEFSGLRGASESLGVGQATLSVALKNLEGAIGHKLFERKSKKLVLNEWGVLVLEYAKEIFRLGDELIEVLNDHPTHSRAPLTIAALDGVPKSVFFQIVERALSEHKHQIITLEGKGETLFAELAQHKIDLVVSNFPPAAFTDAKFYTRSLGRLPVIMCGSAKFKSLAKGFPQSLEGQPIVLPTGHSRLRHDVDHFLQKHHLNLDVRAESQDGSLQKIMGENHVGIFPVSKVSVQQELDEKNFLILANSKAFMKRYGSSQLKGAYTIRPHKNYSKAIGV